MGKLQPYRPVFFVIITDIVLHALWLVAIIFIITILTPESEFFIACLVLSLVSAAITALTFLFARRNDVQGLRISAAVGAVYSTLISVYFYPIFTMVIFVLTPVVPIAVIRAGALLLTLHPSFERYYMTPDTDRMNGQKGLILEAQLQQVVHNWVKSGQDDSCLLHGELLQQMNRWAETRPLPDVARIFLLASGMRKSVGIGYRLGAVLVDILLVGIITFFVVMPLDWFLPAMACFLIVIRVIGNRAGRTPGMWVWGLKLVSLDGSPITWYQATVRAILIGFTRKDYITRTAVVLVPSRSDKPLALRAIVYLAWWQILWSALIITIVIDGARPASGVVEHNVPSAWPYAAYAAGFLKGFKEELLDQVGLPSRGYDYEAAGAALSPIMFAGFCSILILVMVRLRAATAITILSILSIWAGLTIPIVMTVLSARRSVRAYCQGGTAWQKAYHRYKQRTFLSRPYGNGP